MIDERVKDWMTREVVSINADQSLPEAHKLMDEHRVRRLPVIDGDELVGIVTRGDVRQASPSDATSLSIFELHYLLARLPVSDIMTRDPITVSPSTRLTEAAKLMIANKVSGFPVLEGKQVVGVVTESDIFRAFVKLMEES